MLDARGGGRLLGFEVGISMANGDVGRGLALDGLLTEFGLASGRIALLTPFGRDGMLNLLLSASELANQTFPLLPFCLAETSPLEDMLGALEGLGDETGVLTEETVDGAALLPRVAALDEDPVDAAVATESGESKRSGRCGHSSTARAPRRRLETSRRWKRSSICNETERKSLVRELSKF